MTLVWVSTCIEPNSPVQQLVPLAVAVLGEDGVNVGLAHRQLCMVPRQGKPAALARLAIVHVRMPPPDVHALPRQKCAYVRALHWQLFTESIDLAVCLSSVQTVNQ